jgi:di/tricarboxylate transporter
VPAGEAFAGFGHPAVVSVAWVLVLSRGLQTSGAIDALAPRILPAASGPTLTIASLAGLAAVRPRLPSPPACSLPWRCAWLPRARSTRRSTGGRGLLRLPHLIGHQNNTLILGWGGFRFGDYWRLGLPLEILVVAIGVPAIVFVWPL